MDRLLIATGNENKFKEIKSIFAEVPLDLSCLSDFQERPEIIEDGKSFFENAKKKAQVSSDFYNLPALGEDSGLEVFSLGMKPGIYSARFSGPDANDKKNIEKLLNEMREVPDKDRKARFVCFAVIFSPGGRVEKFRGEVEGIIIREPRGKEGFGYDPVFYLPDLKKTMAQISLEKKNQISHRYKAMKAVKNYFLKNNTTL